MVIIPVSPWKNATTRSLVVVVVVAVTLVAAFVLLLRMVYGDAQRPASEEEKDRCWSKLEEAARL